MNKIFTKIKDLPSERKYLMIIGLVIFFNGIIAAVSGLASFIIGLFLAPFCIFSGYYGVDIQKGIEGMKKDIDDVKNEAVNTAGKAKETAVEVESKAGKTVKVSAKKVVKK